MIHDEKMIMVGSTGRNSGKTTLVTDFLKAYKNHYQRPIGLKVTSIVERDGKCPRGGEGCGVCSSIKSDFDIKIEENPNLNKDTSKIKNSGADEVFWIRSIKECLKEAFTDFQRQAGFYDLVLCESNSLRHYVRPKLFIMIKNTSDDQIKPSAKEVIHMADIVIDAYKADTLVLKDIKDKIS